MRKNIADLKRRALSHDDALHGYKTAPHQAYRLEMQEISPSRRQNFGLRIVLMNSVPLQPIIAVLAGVLILLRPALLNYVVALYLIIIGILGIIGPRRL
jgi:threonine/homoserine efflux transporter RhtA